MPIVSVQSRTIEPAKGWTRKCDKGCNRCSRIPIIGQQGEIRPRSFPRRNQKKLAFFFIFVLLSFLKKKQFPIISPFKRSLTLQNGK